MTESINRSKRHESKKCIRTRRGRVYIRFEMGKARDARDARVSLAAQLNWSRAPDCQRKGPKQRKATQHNSGHGTGLTNGHEGESRRTARVCVAAAVSARLHRGTEIHSTTWHGGIPWETEGWLHGSEENIAQPHNSRRPPVTHTTARDPARPCAHY